MCAQFHESSGTNVWQAIRVRATTFLSPDVEIDENSIWPTVVGGVPEEEQRRAREGLLQQMGTMADLVVVFRIVHPRVDWFVQPPAQAQGMPPDSPDWGVVSFDHALQTLFQLSTEWFSIVTGVNRIAFGANLVRPASSLTEAHIDLAGHLSELNFGLEGSSDFLYQINRPRPSEVVNGLEINRLSKWAIMIQTTGNFVLQDAAGEQVSLQPSSREYASSLELDINTRAGPQLAGAPTQLNDIFRELTEMGKEISVQGDIP